ncbi:trypsin-4-like [Cebidichthys violaceus]|uniref:trypsin-4-like n=1 Tax=Cebidichthys violaceus TaxID=271503 RepID=UPI0035CB270E
MTAMARLTSLLFVLWVGVTVGTVVDLQKRIFGGHQCGQTERLYHVVLIGHDGTSHNLCGGSLISDQWILTAAHCWKPGWTIKAVLGRHPHPVKIVDIEAKPEIFQHKDIMNIIRNHDIMLLKLPDRTQIKPLGDFFFFLIFYLFISLYCRPVSYVSKTLQCAEIGVVDCQELRSCLQKNYPKKYSAGRYQHWFCGQSCRVDTCPGDSGGGVVLNGRIYGVHSFTSNPHYVCTSAVGFMKVCGYIDWINTVINRPNTVNGKAKGCVGCG